MTLHVLGVELSNLIVVIPTLWILCRALYVKWFKPTGLAPWLETLFQHGTN